MSSRSRLESPRPSHIALAVALAVTASGNAAAGPARSSPWQRLRADQRFDDLATMSPAQRRAFARDYGLDALLPGTEGTTRVVTNCNDGGPGSLRGVVQGAADGDVIDLSALTCGMISLSTGAIAIGYDNLTLKGPGAHALTIRNIATYGRVIAHFGVGALTLAGMTIERGTIVSNASENAAGGCVFSHGTVTLGALLAPAGTDQGVVVRDCTAIAQDTNRIASGGGVSASAGIAMTSSVVSGCVARSRGAGLGAYGGGISTSGVLQLKYSEIDGNAVRGSKARGGGINGIVTSALITHSAIVRNQSDQSSGGVFLGNNTGGSFEIHNTTISGNVANSVGGLDLDGGYARMGGTPLASINLSALTIASNYSGLAFWPGGAWLRGNPTSIDSTILSGNLSGAGPYDVELEQAATGANNLVGTAVGTLPTAGLVMNDDPRLAPIANNHGETHTQALLPGSPAIDAGNNVSGDNHDQRGLMRVVGSGPDIGAFERDPDVIFFNGFD